MTPSVATRQAWARPFGILLDEERPRMTEYVQLFWEQLKQVAAVPHEPTMVERIAARRRAASIWMFDRVTSDAKHMKMVRSEVGRAHQQAELSHEVQYRHGLTAIVLDEIEMTNRLLEQTQQRQILDATPKGVRVPLQIVGGGDDTD